MAEALQQASDADRADGVGSSCSRSGAPGFSVDGKNIVRIPPLLLGQIGEAAAGVSEGSLVCSSSMRFVWLFAHNACLFGNDGAQSR
jgi:hypothetical protein